MEWKAVWRHKDSDTVFSEYSYDLYELQRELTKLKENGHKVLSEPFPTF
jgi:hypothetical protein